MFLPTTKWSWSFISVAVTQALIVLAFECYGFAMFQIDARDADNPEQSRSNVATTIPTFLALYIFGFFYQLVLVYDALRLKNTIQVIGLVILNAGLLIYGAVQLDTLRDGVQSLGGSDGWSQVKPFLIAIPCILALGTVVLAFIARKLYDEFAWTIYKHISADLRMKRRYLTYQIYIALLKFDFFFFLGFTIQFVVIVRGRDTAEFGLTIAAIPVTIAVLFAAAFFTRKEKLWGMILVLIFFVAGLAYFIFKLTRIFSPSHDQPYRPAWKELTTFAVITIILILLTLVNAIMCCMNFNKGLKPYITSRKLESDEEKLSHGGTRSQVYSMTSGESQAYGGYAYPTQNVELVQSPFGKTNPPARMAID